MRKLIISLATIIALVGIILIGSASAQNKPPFVGRWHWDGPETCVKGYENDNVAMEITASQLIFYENRCKIRSARKLEDKSYRLQLVCWGEGMTERNEIILAMLTKSKLNDELLLRIELRNGFVVAYRRCP